MRVLVWSERFWPGVGGVELYLERVIADLRAAGHEVAVLTADRSRGRPDEDELDGVPVHRIPLFEVLRERRPEAILALKQRVSSFTRSFRPNITHVNLLGPGPVMFLDASAGHIVVAVHITFERLQAAGPDTLFGRTLRQAAWITACSARSLASALALVPDLAPVSSVVPYGIDVPEAEPQPAVFSPPHLVCIGRLVRMKGFDLAIRALARLRETAHDATLTIAGDGPERALLEALAAQEGVSASVRFTGELSQTDAFNLLSRASMLLVPSRVTQTEYSEGLPFVVLEAGGMGRATIGARAGGMAEAIIDGVTGVLVESDDVTALAAAVRECLADPIGTEEMGRRARARVRASFTRHASFAALHSLFTRITPHA
jgi:glycosyltransferase involved in cell wall biosynthesis